MQWQHYSEIVIGYYVQKKELKDETYCLKNNGPIISGDELIIYPNYWDQR